eukprot:scaffold422659_cov59-Attheya_sp.AAC.3
MGAKNDDMDVVNRWKGVERTKGARPSCPMRHHYAELSLLIQPFLRYTRAMWGPHHHFPCLILQKRTLHAH